MEMEKYNVPGDNVNVFRVVCAVGDIADVLNLALLAGRHVRPLADKVEADRAVDVQAVAVLILEFICVVRRLTLVYIA